MLEITTERDVDGDFDIHTAMDETGPSPIVSCVALYRNGWVPGWPALGGTRWIQPVLVDSGAIKAATWGTAKELAISMAMKNNLLRNAERALAAESERWSGRADLFGWQGGKGVIWAPKGGMTPQRLFCHGRLIESLGGEYIGSKDQGIGTRELKWISMATGFTIGLGCQRDTGEGTAAGVLASMYRAASEIGLVEGPPLSTAELIGPASIGLAPGASAISDDDRSAASRTAFGGLRVLVLGLGKVGLPLTRFLHDRGAECYVYDPRLLDRDADAFYRGVRSSGAAVGEPHRELLAKLVRSDRVFPDEIAALTASEIQAMSPTGGRTGWLSSAPVGTEATRCSLIADAGSCRLVLGAGNDQLPATEGCQSEREEALTILTQGDVAFVPDPIVSPGGVVAVSHERAEHWDGHRVILDSAELAERGVRALFAQASSNGGATSTELYHAFEQLARSRTYSRLSS